MVKVRIHEIAKELGIKSKEVVEKAADLGLDVKSASSAVGSEEAEALMNFVLTGERQEANTPAQVVTPVAPEPTEEPSPKAPKPKKETPVQEAPPSPDEPKEAPAPKKPKTPKPEEEKKEVPVTPPVEEPAPEPVSEEKKSTISSGESLAQASLMKRRGLVIVKKKKPEVVAKPEVVKPVDSLKKNIPSSLESIFSTQTETAESKKKKKTKKTPSTKKESAEKIDLLADRDLGEANYDQDDLVVLPDLTVKPEPEAPKPALKKRNDSTQQIIGRGQKAVAFGNATTGIRRRGRKKRPKQITKGNDEAVTSVRIPEEIRVYEFAEMINKQPSEIISKLFMLGMLTTKNDFLDKDAIEILADEFGIEVETVNAQEEFDYVKAYDDDDEGELQERAPVITIMGHVDHGKTSLLDYIRSSRVVHGESGGITQHVGAYMVHKNNKNITFIDTPGHEAFTQMRARGAEVTDIVIIVVAADDGVKPQTKEAIEHAKAADVPIIIAINKMDKEAANPDMVKTQLSDLGIMPTEWGGSHEFVGVSAHTGQGIEELLEIILLQAEILELEANPTRDAKAVVIESSLEKGRGPVATIVVQNGTLRVGDTVVAGVAYGKVRALLDHAGKAITSIKPGEPGVIVGLSEVAEAGEKLVKVESDKAAREYAQKRHDYLRQKELSRSTKVTLDELSQRIAEGEIKDLPVIIKADVQGSLEAIKGSLAKLRNDETKVNVIHAGIGGVTESDVALASASENCIILGFHIRPTGTVKEKAKNLGVEIKTYNIIYDLIDDVKGVLSGMMAPIIREENLGQAQVREVFVVPKVGAIAGCIVTDGVINRGAKVRLIRDGVIVYEGTVSSLKRFKDDVREVSKGYECGIGIHNFNDIKEGDFMESFKEVEEKVSL
ncbi:translation initiation factor IF-2 [Sulfurospirillum sp. T05]|uniref:Translation initiation factor IF-2 n=1 Tax=Sulfurospirillum tamanense TaxID=2813362 RepID=A0ABS2WPA3_9BACT|nr:translation initiation factor IF-2 [Sulfurospirillum tamanensis]MBN2963453.1 translation initiation factor IF-2 [Sulfurospirillum tamanensis]